MADDNDPVDFAKAREKRIALDKEQREKALKKRFKKAMGLKTKPKKRTKGSKGPKPRGRR